MNCCLGFFEVGTCYHELFAAYVFGALDDIVEIAFVGLFAVVVTLEHGVTQVDADLEGHDWLVDWIQ